MTEFEKAILEEIRGLRAELRRLAERQVIVERGVVRRPLLDIRKQRQPESGW
jgi:hypothetical protein